MIWADRAALVVFVITVLVRFLPCEPRIRLGRGLDSLVERHTSFKDHLRLALALTVPVWIVLRLIDFVILGWR